MKDWRAALCLLGGTLCITMVTYATQVTDQGIINGECFPIVAAFLLLLYNDSSSQLWCDRELRAFPHSADQEERAAPVG